MLHQGCGLLALRGRAGGGGGVDRIEQLNEGCGQLFRCSPLRLPLLGMPVPISDAQLPMQLASQLLGLGRPELGAAAGVVGAGHWTRARASGHPGAMHQRPRSPHTPIRWLHQLAGLMAQVSSAERLQARDDSLAARRLRQRMALAQRLLDPLPRPLRQQSWRERTLWTALRWGGPAMVLALWLRR
jgi:hypothetical protein